VRELALLVAELHASVADDGGFPQRPPREDVRSGVRKVLTFVHRHVRVQEIEPQRSPLTETVRLTLGQLDLDISHGAITAPLGDTDVDGVVELIPETDHYF
jgi:hypothetical protein